MTISIGAGDVWRFNPLLLFSAGILTWSVIQAYNYIYFGGIAEGNTETLSLNQNPSNRKVPVKSHRHQRAESVDFAEFSVICDTMMRLDHDE